MDHIAIMKKSWNLIELILNKQKIIESRWYKTKRTPWNKIKENEIIYFKNSGEPVTAKAEIEKVLQFENLTNDKIKEILITYGTQIKISDLEKSYNRNQNKKYCILIFLKNPTKIEPFNINKKGFGLMSAWITIEDINQIKPDIND